MTRFRLDVRQAPRRSSPPGRLREGTRRGGAPGARSWALAVCSALALALALPAAALAAAPTISSPSFSQVTETAATLEANVNTEGKKSEYHFQYIAQADYKADGGSFGAGSHSVPEPEGSLPAHASVKGDLLAGSTTVTGLTSQSGVLATGQAISGAGIPASTTIVSLEETELTLSKAVEAGKSSPQVLLTATGPQPVAAKVSGLGPGTAYRMRLLAHNSDGPSATAGSEKTFATFPAVPLFGPCPNDPFRSGELASFGHPSAALPDCRAYEQVTPVDKNGADAGGEANLVRAAPGGGAVSYLSSAGIPGGVGGQAIPSYAAVRGPEGWATHGLLPPASTGRQAHIAGWLPDFSTDYALVEKTEGESAKVALLALSPGRPPTVVAPYTEYSEVLRRDAAGEEFLVFAGASAGGEQVLFDSPAKLPGAGAALEGRPNVYAWDRVGQALHLAGVLNNGEAPPEGAFVAPYNWAGGTNKTTLAEGGPETQYYTQDSHAISSQGDVFFTAAGSGRLYERLDPTAPQSAVLAHPGEESECTEPGKACTLQLSASEKENGKGPGRSDAAGPRPAAFMAATPDGATAFFTSSEKLTDDATTGPEPELPAVARSGLEGQSKNITFIPAQARGVAIQGAYAYWADPAAGAIGRARLDGSEPPEDAFIAGVGSPQWLALDAGHVYWTNTGPLGPDGHGGFEAVNEAGTIGRAEIDGSGNLVAGSVEPEFIKGASNPQGIAVDASHIYWTNHNHGEEREKFEGVGRANIEGKEVTQEWTLAADGQPHGFNCEGIALDSKYLYCTQGSATIKAFTLSNPINFYEIYLPAPTSRLEGIAVHAGHLYWTDAGEDAIGRATLNEAEPLTEVQAELVRGAGQPIGLALDASNLYWSANQNSEPNPGNDLYRFQAGAPRSRRLTDLSVDPADPNGAEVRGVLGTSEDGAYVYFAADGVLAANAGAMGTHAARGDCGADFRGNSGSCNLYLWHQGTTEFIAPLDAAGAVIQSDSLDWAPAISRIFGSGNTTNPKTAFVSADGRTLLFRSQEQLTPYDNRGVTEFYRFQEGAQGEPVTCVSCNPTGAPPLAPAGFGSIALTAFTPRAGAATTFQILSADGGRAFFESDDPLVAADTNGAAGCPQLPQLPSRSCQDVYEWEAPGFGSCQVGGPGYATSDAGCLYLLSSGKETDPAYLADASADGEDVFIFSRSQLVGQDTDELNDVYDARVDGGLASQATAPEVPCEGEACKPPVTQPAPPESPASANFHGSGGPPHPPKCRKGTVRRHRRCVRRSGHHHHPHHKRRSSR